uniref:Uncharacterized protein n=1 Tax=Cucumis melo TaxID=3656 RepID=A0A9I9DI78_CUCME
MWVRTPITYSNQFLAWKLFILSHSPTSLCCFSFATHGGFFET